MRLPTFFLLALLVASAQAVAKEATSETVKSAEGSRREHILESVKHFEEEHFKKGELEQSLNDNKEKIIESFQKWTQEHNADKAGDTAFLSTGAEWFFHHAKPKDPEADALSQEELNDLMEEAWNKRSTAEDYRNLRENQLVSVSTAAVAPSLNQSSDDSEKAKSLAHNAAKIATFISKQAIESSITVTIPKCSLDSNEIVEFCNVFKNEQMCQNKLVFGYNVNSQHYYVGCQFANNTCFVGDNTTSVCRVQWDSNKGSERCKCKNGWCAEGTSDVCTCHTGYTGDLCETMSACFKNCGFGWCDEDGICNCNNGYAGARCNVEYTDTCLSSCVNGYCDNGQCICRYGWSGETCDQYNHPSQTIPCHGCQHGWCELQNDPPTCSCNAGWKGDNCDVTDVCMDKCEHGYCNSGTCVCEEGFGGLWCNDPVVTSF
jgi:type II secretory pathway pseudopilin PulG